MEQFVTIIFIYINRRRGSNRGRELSHIRGDLCTRRGVCVVSSEWSKYPPDPIMLIMIESNPGNRLLFRLLTILREQDWFGAMACETR